MLGTERMTVWDAAKATVHDPKQIVMVINKHNNSFFMITSF